MSQIDNFFEELSLDNLRDNILLFSNQHQKIGRKKALNNLQLLMIERAKNIGFDKSNEYCLGYDQAIKELIVFIESDIA